MHGLPSKPVGCPVESWCISSITEEGEFEHQDCRAICKRHGCSDLVSICNDLRGRRVDGAGRKRGGEEGARMGMTKWRVYVVRVV
jgi:hypothetical protein